MWKETEQKPSLKVPLLYQPAVTEENAWKIVRIAGTWIRSQGRPDVKSIPYHLNHGRSMMFRCSLPQPKTDQFWLPGDPTTRFET